MNDMEFRMECLRLAVGKINCMSSLSDPPIGIKTDVELAQEYFAFVRGGPEKPEPLKVAA